MACLPVSCKAFSVTQSPGTVMALRAATRAAFGARQCAGLTLSI